MSDEHFNSANGSADGNFEPFEPEDPSDTWVPDAAIENLSMERRVNSVDELTNEELSRKILRDGSPIAAQSLVHLATRGSTERIRLDASKYVLDRVLGRAGDDLNIGDSSPLQSFFDEITDFVNTANPS